MPATVEGAPLPWCTVDVPIRLQLVHSNVPITVQRGSIRWRMPSVIVSGSLSVVLAAPFVETGARMPVTFILPSIFWLIADRYPRPIVVYGVGVKVTPAVRPQPQPVPDKVK